MAHKFLNVARFLGISAVIERLASRLCQPSESGFTQEMEWSLLRNVVRL